jgi:hypothetical protein
MVTRSQRATVFRGSPQVDEALGLDAAAIQHAARHAQRGLLQLVRALLADANPSSDRHGFPLIALNPLSARSAEQTMPMAQPRHTL